MYPARTSSRWLGTSASAGSSRRVRTNRLDIRRIMSRRVRAEDARPRSGYGRNQPHRAGVYPGAWTLVVLKGRFMRPLLRTLALLASGAVAGTLVASPASAVSTQTLN